MPEDTKAKADTSEEEGKNSDKAKAEGDKATDADKGQDAKQFTQDDLNRIAAQTRKEEQEKARKAKEKEDKEREEAKAKEQGEYQKLAEGYKAELDTLKPKHEQMTADFERYRAVVTELAASELKALPDEVRDSSPASYGEDKNLSNPLDVLAWLPKGKALAAKLEGQPAKPGAREDPKPKGQNGDAEADKRAKSAQGAITKSAFG